MARVHFRRGEWAEAVAAYEFAVEGYEAVLGPEHAGTVKSAAALTEARAAADG
ncbi:tetratricopeptide repeat protein [Amycolatopsis rifamycinica]|uniref:tetratricopeptide repeat protein n=1 Tax=Amycolatopsis rifamycinica TaxID=287986 RepID=UPI000A7D4BBA|nr:tetratricopeptide repeat protein [Amycolatopsis rifamycinica]